MPGFAIQIDGARVATIDFAGQNVVQASFFGALDKEEKAILDASGGNYGEDESIHLIWIAERAIQIGQVMTIQFMEACEGADKGKTIGELFPDVEISPQTDFSITDEMAAEMRARPQLHEAFTVNVETSSGYRATASSDVSNTSFSTSVLWNWTRPEQARVELRTYCLDDVLERKLGTTHLEEVLSFGDSVTFTLVA